VQKNPLRQKIAAPAAKKAKSKSPISKSFKGDNLGAHKEEPQLANLLATFQPEDTFHIFNQPNGARPSFSTTGKLSVFKKR
jgi:hypothetical protein